MQADSGSAKESSVRWCLSGLHPRCIKFISNIKEKLLWRTIKLKNARIYPAFAYLRLARNIAVPFAKKRALRKMKLLAIVGMDPVRNDERLGKSES